jgi:hypothetical protein
VVGLATAAYQSLRRPAGGLIYYRNPPVACNTKPMLEHQHLQVLCAAQCTMS